MALQRKNEPGGRSLMFTVRVSEQERKALQVKANAMKVSVARMMVDGALKADDTHDATVWMNELLKLRRLIAEHGYSDEIDTQIRDLIHRMKG